MGWSLTFPLRSTTLYAAGVCVSRKLAVTIGLDPHVDDFLKFATVPRLHKIIVCSSLNSGCDLRVGTSAANDNNPQFGKFWVAPNLR